LRNPSKLLDKNLASAQGPALLFYNDSIFTENDFKALIKLGAGTKRESKEKNNQTKTMKIKKMEIL
jgi:sacsin